MNSLLQIRTMTAADLLFADSLRAQAGWNQTLRDWQRILAHEPEGCFVALREGKPAGTATTTCFGREVAWIGMMLVAPEHRRSGVGTALLKHCLDFLIARGVECIKLDATPLGKALYDQYGFADEWTLTRWEVQHFDPASVTASPKVRPWKLTDHPMIQEIDHEAFGCNRFKMLLPLAHQGHSALVHKSDANTIDGFGLMRRGERAAYLGPLVTRSAATALALLQSLLAYPASRSIYWDIPDQNQEAVALAKRFGFRPQRPLIRMYRGQKKFSGRPDMQFGIAAPEIG